MSFALKDIQHFLVIAESGDLARAARRLGLTATALRSSIRRVEETFGLELLQRNARGVRITETGLHFLETARRLSAVHGDAVHMVDEIREKKSRVFCLAFSDPASATWMAPAVTETLEAFPEARIRCRIGLSTPLITQGLASGDIDIAVASAEGPIAAGCDSLLLGHDPMRLVVRKKHPLAQQPPPSLQTLLQYRWCVTSPSPWIIRSLNDLFENAKLALPPLAFQVDQPVRLALELARRSDLVALVTQSEWQADPRGLQELRPPRFALARAVHLLTRSDTPLSPPMEHLLRSLIALGTTIPAN